MGVARRKGDPRPQEADRKRALRRERVRRYRRPQQTGGAVLRIEVVETRLLA
jgi:hypothetical protein